MKHCLILGKVDGGITSALHNPAVAYATFPTHEAAAALADLVNLELTATVVSSGALPVQLMIVQCNGLPVAGDLLSTSESLYTVVEE